MVGKWSRCNFENNVPRYVLVEYSQLGKVETVGDEEVYGS